MKSILTNKPINFPLFLKGEKNVVSQFNLKIVKQQTFVENLWTLDVFLL